MDTETHTKTGYDFLREMTAFETDFNAYNTPRYNPITNRVEYITHQLTKMNVPFVSDTFDAYDVKKKDGKFNYININVLISGKNESETVVFLAHHDTNRRDAENAQDNTASICNLLDLISQLKDKELDRNVLVVFTDSEEIVDWKCSGAAKLAYDMKSGKYGTVLHSVNLELTGLGRNLWVSAYGNNSLLLKCIELGAAFKPTPFSDTFSLWQNGIDNTVCIGILPDNEIRQQDMNKISTWRLCHQLDDTFEKCSKEDMSYFVENFLMKFL